MNHHVHYRNFRISCFTFIFLSLQRHFYLLFKKYCTQICWLEPWVRAQILAPRRGFKPRTLALTVRCSITELTRNLEVNQDSFGNSSFMSWTSKKTILIINYCLQLRVFEMVAQSGFEPLISNLWGSRVNQTSLPRNLEIENHSLEKQSSKGEIKAWLITSGQSCM